MTQLPALKGRDVVRALQKAGFVVIRTSGSHHRLGYSTDPSRTTTVPVHAGKTLGRGTLHGIHQTGWIDRRGVCGAGVAVSPSTRDGAKGII